jgi:archaeal type IV pilus assembly protein PilA
MEKNENAVSPVIGVILMVAITVILAAVIAAFVFGMSGNIPKTKVIAVSAHQIDSGTVTLTYEGGQDAMMFSGASANVTDDNGNFLTVPNLSNVVGNSVKATGALAKNNHVVVVGHFYDGNDQVLLDTYV